MSDFVHILVFGRSDRVRADLGPARQPGVLRDDRAIVRRGFPAWFLLLGFFEVCRYVGCHRVHSVRVSVADDFSVFNVAGAQ